MKHPITKLRLALRSFYGKKRRSSIYKTLREANIEPKWWMGEHIFTDKNTEIAEALLDKR